MTMSSDGISIGNHWCPVGGITRIPRTVLLSSSSNDRARSYTHVVVDNDDASMDNSSGNSESDLEDVSLQSHSSAPSTRSMKQQRDLTGTILPSSSGDADRGMLSVITRAFTHLVEGVHFVEGVSVKTIHIIMFTFGVSLVVIMMYRFHSDGASSMVHGMRGAAMLNGVEQQQQDEKYNSVQTLLQRYYIAQQQPDQSQQQQQQQQQAAYLGAQPKYGLYNQSPLQLQMQQQIVGQQVAVPLDSATKDIAATAAKVAEEASVIMTNVASIDAGETTSLRVSAEENAVATGVDASVP